MTSYRYTVDAHGRSFEVGNISISLLERPPRGMFWEVLPEEVKDPSPTTRREHQHAGIDESLSRLRV